MTVAEQMKNTSGSASQQLLTSTKIKEGMNMANRSSNTAAVPEAKGALDKFKFEVASELGVPLSDGYNGKSSRFFLAPAELYIILTDQCFRLHHH